MNYSEETVQKCLSLILEKAKENPERICSVIYDIYKSVGEELDIPFYEIHQIMRTMPITDITISQYIENNLDIV